MMETGQAPLFAPAVNAAFIAPQNQPDSFERARLLALRLIEANAAKFRDDFGAWLYDNFHIYREFERRANRLWQAGRRHYSARTIMEVVRFETDLREANAESSEWKINNNIIPDCARLYTLIFRSKESLFEFRGRSPAPTNHQQEAA